MAEQAAQEKAQEAERPALVGYAAAQGVATLTLDSPANRNALSPRLMSELAEGLAAAAADPGVRVAVLTHTGGTFCAGADLSGSDPAEGTARLLALLRRIVELPKPVVARVDGHVRAGGLGLLGACDLAVAGPGSTFAFTEARLGLAPAIISLTTLPRLSGRAAARYYLTGERFDAATAERIGLITSAPDGPDGLDAELDALLNAFRACSPQGLAETKALTTRGVLRAFAEHGEEMTALSARLFRSEEAREGLTAWLERRRPRWAAGHAP
ncbi:enoyl-CoA hydratase family protein [Streptomyces sp. DSM 44917]|uniref:Enoyl-CoA hydratase family protein n=1 Tax=Streptomyces boetiae TaxID=3075541 RepID=A0ABU2L3Z5_9ACTN|nr:enoyl-CoA hydratase family protein [Streptomyces sp. DSM 44917]MDT0306280.1 enoyl-CoA hydratase family protein [Streptomyces sp. DSM 44917]